MCSIRFSQLHHFYIFNSHGFAFSFTNALLVLPQSAYRNFNSSCPLSILVFGEGRLLYTDHRTTQSQPIAPPTVTAVNADCCWRGLATAFIRFNCLNGAPLPRASALPLLSQNPKRTLEKLRRRGESEHLLFPYYNFVQTDYCLL